MDPYPAGWLSLLPPFAAILLAIATKDVLASLFVGVMSGAFVYSMAMSPSPLIDTVRTTFSIIVGKADIELILFCSLLGSLVYVIDMAGGTLAYGKWAHRHMKNRRQALLTTGGLGALIFIDDYFNCLTIGTIMKPITDRYGISRAKLAYVIDATAAPVCIIAPISSWAAAVGSEMKATGAFESSMSAFVATIPWNFYALLSIVMIFIICFFQCDYGPMAAAERRAANGDLGISIVKEPQRDMDCGPCRISDMLIPICALLAFSIAAMLHTGGYWEDGPAKRDFITSIGACAVSTSLLWASFGALLVAFLLFVPRRLMTLRRFMDGVVDGIRLMLPACLILLLAWAISGVCRDLLSTPQFVRGLLTGTSIGAPFLPAGIFVLSAVLSFSIGNSWATFSILIPIIVPTAQAAAPELLIVCLSATLAGSVFGDHCSPISDTTILSSAGACCNHVEHVTTQMGYAFTVAVCCTASYLVAGLTDGALLPSLLTGFMMLVAGVVLLHCHSTWTKRSA